MKDEIKEILECLSLITRNEYVSDELLNDEMCQQLLDYITNLQEDLRDACEVIEQLKKDKLRAIDEIQYIIDYGFDYDGFNKSEDLKGLIDMLVDYASQSIDILKGKDIEFDMLKALNTDLDDDVEMG